MLQFTTYLGKTYVGPKITPKPYLWPYLNQILACFMLRAPVLLLAVINLHNIMHLNIFMILVVWLLKCF